MTEAERLQADAALYRMQEARVDVKNAFGKLLAADGLDEILDDLTAIYMRLTDEIREFKEHTYGVTDEL